MIEDFKFQDSFERIKREKIKKVKDTNDLYQQTITIMKEKVKKEEQKRMKKIKKNIKDKNRIVNLNKQKKEREKEEEIFKARNEREKMSKSAETNASLNLELIEERRIIEEQRTEEKSK